MEPCLLFHEGGHWRELIVRTNSQGHTMAIITFHPQELRQVRLTGAASVATPAITMLQLVFGSFGVLFNHADGVIKPETEARLITKLIIMGGPLSIFVRTLPMEVIRCSTKSKKQFNRD